MTTREGRRVNRHTGTLQMIALGMFLNAAFSFMGVGYGEKTSWFSLAVSLLCGILLFGESIQFEMRMEASENGIQR